MDPSSYAYDTGSLVGAQLLPGLLGMPGKNFKPVTRIFIWQCKCSKDGKVNDLQSFTRMGHRIGGHCPSVNINFGLKRVNNVILFIMFIC